MSCTSPRSSPPSKRALEPSSDEPLKQARSGDMCSPSGCSADSASAAARTGAATLTVDAKDYECAICLSLLLDPVVGECAAARAAVVAVVVMKDLNHRASRYSLS